MVTDRQTDRQTHRHSGLQSRARDKKENETHLKEEIPTSIPSLTVYRMNLTNPRFNLSILPLSFMLPLRSTTSETRQFRAF